MVSGVVNFFKTFLTIGPTFLLIVTALTGAFFTFKSVLGPLLEKMGLAVKSEDAKSEIDARKNLKTRMKEISPALGKEGRTQFKSDLGKYRGRGLLDEARKLGISEDDPALAAYRDSLMLEDTKAKLEMGERV